MPGAILETEGNKTIPAPKELVQWEHKNIKYVTGYL